MRERWRRADHPYMRAAVMNTSEDAGQARLGRLTAGCQAGLGTARWSGSPPVAIGPEFDVQRAQILAPEIVQRRELILTARIV